MLVYEFSGNLKDAVRRTRTSLSLVAHVFSLV